MKKILMLIILAALLLLVGCAAQESDYRTYDFFAMDTSMRLTLAGEDALSDASLTEQRIRALEDTLSRTKEDSLVARLNRGETVTDADLAALLRFCMDYTEKTDGAFDVTVADVVAAWGFTTDSYQVPDAETLAALLPYVGSDGITLDGNTVSLKENVRIDLGGIAKGYASDCVKELWDELGIESGIAALGGNIYCRGSKSDAAPWTVGIRDPKAADGYVGLLSLADRFAVTSGGYERWFEDENGNIYHHIIDPKTGYPARSGLSSVTVVSESGTAADALSTALYVLGADRAIALWRELGSFELVLVTEDGRVLVTEGLAESFDSASEDYSYEYIR